MMITKRAISRRTVLRGLGVSMALPLLDSMVPAMTAMAATPAAPSQRFGFIYVPHGSIMREWTPAQEGSNFEFSTILKPLEDFRKDPTPREWRTHFHVPVFLDDLGEFGTTRFAIEDALKFHKNKPLSRQLEIETYTWDVLPDSMKTGSIVDYVQRELDWVKGQLV
mgnify:CR=1 FL=1